MVEDLLELRAHWIIRRVLEVGCGTGRVYSGQPRDRSGCRGGWADLGGVGTAEPLARFPNARVETAAFEDWPLPPEPFDAVVVANAFHWLDPDARFSKSARGLGWVAT